MVIAHIFTHHYNTVLGWNPIQSILKSNHSRSAYSSRSPSFQQENNRQEERKESSDLRVPAVDKALQRDRDPNWDSLIDDSLYILISAPHLVSTTHKAEDTPALQHIPPQAQIRSVALWCIKKTSHTEGKQTGTTWLYTDTAFDYMTQSGINPHLRSLRMVVLTTRPLTWYAFGELGIFLCSFVSFNL